MKWLTDNEFFGTELVEEGDRALRMGSAIGQNFLSSLATSPDFLAKMQVAFGNSFDVEKAVKLASAWAQGDFSKFPEIEIRSEAEINGALGAFAVATGKIYLSREFLAKNAGNVMAVAGVLLEEFGHFVDSQINRVDAIGDEGEIFSDLVQGKALSQGELATLKGEDDSAIVVLDGELRAIEQANIKNQSEKIDFFANDINLSQNPFSQEFRYNDLTFSRQLAGTLPFGLNADIFDAKFDYDFNASIGLIPYLQLKQLGKTTFKYPISVNTSLPSQLDRNETSIIQTSNYQVENTLIKGSGLSLLKAGLDFQYDLGPWKIDSFIQSNLLGINQNVNLINFPKINDIFNLFETSFDVPVVDGVVINSGEFFEVKVTLPEIEKFQQKPSKFNSFPSIEATGKADVISVSADIDKFLLEQAAVRSLPLAILKGAIDTISKRVTRDTPLELKFNGLGFSLKFPQTQNARVSVEASLDILDVSANLKLGLQQDLKLVPDVQVTMSVDKGLVDGSLTSTKPLGEGFNITAPSEGSGVMEVKAKYELLGNIENNLDFILDGNEALKAEILKGKFELNLGKWFKIPSVELGALGSLKIPGDLGVDASITRKKYVSSNDSSALVKIDPLQLQKIEGIEQDENNPQANATKNLIVEKVYKIPYGVPLSISDGTSVTEGNDAGASRQSQAYFTYNGKYYEWQPRTVQLFTGSGGDVLSRIALETLGDASPNAYNFIAFHNNIANPNLIIAASTIQVPKEVTLPDTTGYAVFKVSSSVSGGAAKTNYNTTDGTATAGSDYIATSGTLSIPAGQGGVILVPIVGDTKKEETESFTVTLTRSDGTPISEGVNKLEATGTIFDDDGKPNPPKNGGKTYNDPRIITIDKQYHDFQAAGEFTLIESTTGDLKIQVRQQPIGNDPRSNVADNTAVATVLGGKRIGIYKDQGLLIDGVPTKIAANDSLAIGDGRIYLEGSIYTIVYPTGDQLVAKVAGTTRINVNVYLTDEREGKVKGLLGNFNKNPKDDLAKPDGTVIPEPVAISQLYGEYADSWRVNQAESLFDYKPGENTNTFTLTNYPRQKVKISDLTPADVQKAEQLIGDRIKNPTIREATIIDLVLTNFDPDILEEAINAPVPDSVLAIASPSTTNGDFPTTVNTATKITANSDFTTTTVNTAIKINVLANDTTAKDPLSIKEFNTKSVAGGIITLDNNNTPDDKSDDKLTYTPPPDFTGTDKFNYLLTDGKQIQAATVNININSLKLDKLSGNNGFVLNGTEAGNFSGVAVSKTGDINGDKIDDIIVGSFGADPNNVNAAGKSQVIFGNQKFPASVNLSQLNGQNGFTLNGTDAEGFSGGTVSSAGDINGDGIKDFLIGAFGATVNGQNNAGKTYIVFGTNKGFPANFNLANLNGNNGFAVTGTNSFDYAGLFATGISDINGDRIDDVLISAPGPLGGTPGKSYVIYGRTAGFSPNLNLAQINGNNGFVINGIDGDSSGTASSGDINGDGIPDLVIGADGGNTSGGINAGKTYVIFGLPGGFTGSVNVPELNGTTGFVIAGLTGQERSGIALTATGDINGDGNKDLVIGAPGATVGDRINAGKTYVIFGKKEAFPVIVNPAELNGSNGFTIFGFDAEGSSGNAVSYAGDINKDGFDDLLIGASSANSDDKNNAGKTFIVFGKKEFSANFSLAEANGKNVLVLNGVETDGLVGTAVSGGGDINGDGIDDIIVGAPGSLFQDSPGKSYAVFGSRGFGFANPNNGLQGTVQDDIINGTQADDTISGRQGNDKIFGNSGQDVLSGNLNDDYLDGEKGQDIVIGGDGNDSLFGGLGNDVLKGDNGNDILTGVDINAINPGIEEIDTLTGGGGSDIFVLGDVNNTYYDNLDSDYALIADFNATEDSIQLQGKADDYLLVPFSQANQTGTAIYRKNSAQNELISILQGGANLSLSGGYFRFS